MAITPRRTLTGIIALGLVTISLGGAYALNKAGVGQIITSKIPSFGVAVAFIVGLYLGVRITQEGVVGNPQVEYIGVGVLVALYAVIGSAAIDILNIPIGSVPILIAGLLFYYFVIVAYAYKSSQRFSTWRAKAILTGVSTIMLAVAGSLISAVMIAAFITFFVLMFLEVAHVIGRTKQSGEPDHLRDGGRVFMVIVGFPMTLLRAIVALARKNF